MRLNEEQVLEVITEYIRDERTQQAVLLDGKWGCGKTYFVEHKLIPALKGQISDKIIIYCPLYGYNDVAKIVDEIYLNVFAERLKEKDKGEAAEKLIKCAGIAGKFIKAGLGYLNINATELPQISDYKKLKDVIIIFDDLERCNVEINELFGFVNNLVEHDKIQVIIVADQSQIGLRNNQKQLPEKYMVALNSYVGLVDNSENGSQQTPITKEKLEEKVAYLFSGDSYYKKIKEKLIGLTVNYRTDTRNIYDALREKYVINKNAKTYLNLWKEDVINAFDKEEHYNLRTLISLMVAYDNLLNALSGVTADQAEERQLLEKHCKDILMYCMHEIIKEKTGKPLFDWSESESKMGSTYLKKSHTLLSMYGYEFVDTYILQGFINKEESCSIIQKDINERATLIRKRKEEELLAYNELLSWWKLEDEDVIRVLNQILEEIKNEKYDSTYYKDMLLRFSQMKYNGFNEYDFSKIVDKMSEVLNGETEKIDVRKFMIITDDEEFKKCYDKMAEPILVAIKNNNDYYTQRTYAFLSSDAEWNDAFVENCYNNKENFLEEGQFLKYFNVDNVCKKLEKASPKEIYDFADGIKEVYCFSNLNDFFKKDVNSLNILVEGVDRCLAINKGITRELALKSLQQSLREYLGKLDRDTINTRKQEISN